MAIFTTNVINICTSSNDNKKNITPVHFKDLFCVIFNRKWHIKPDAKSSAGIRKIFFAFIIRPSLCARVAKVWASCVKLMS